MPMETEERSFIKNNFGEFVPIWLGLEIQSKHYIVVVRISQMELIHIIHVLSLKPDVKKSCKSGRFLFKYIFFSLA